MALSDQQKKELNRAIAEYLKKNNCPRALSILKEEACIDCEDNQKYVNLLEKKWSSVIRLQKKIFDLEAKLEETDKELQLMHASCGYGSLGAAPGSGLAGRGNRNSADAIPRPPAKLTLSGHRSPVTRVLFHPHFNVLLSASEDATIKAWDFETGELEQTLKGHTDSVQDLACDHTGAKLASCSADTLIKLWDLEIYSCVKTLAGHEHNVSSVVFLPPVSDFLISASRDKSIKMWEVATGHCIRTFTGHSQWVRCVRPSHDGQRLASGSNDHTIRVWSIDNAKSSLHVLTGHENVVEWVVWATHPQAALAIQRYVSSSGSGDVSPPLDSSLSDKKQNGLDDDPRPEGQAPVNSFLASSSRDRTIRLWNVETGLCIRQLIGHGNWVRQLVFHPHGALLLSASDDKTVRVWDLTNARCQKTLDAHGHFVNTLDFNRKSLTVATGSVENTIRIWDCR